MNTFITMLTPYMPMIAYGLVILFVCLYATLSSIEFGSSLLLISPTPLVDVGTVRRYLNPIWESTNVFLVFALVGTVMFFPTALPVTSVALLPTMMTALIFFAVRAIGILGLMYYGSVSRWFAYLFAVGSLGAPLFLSNIYTYVLSGVSLLIPTTALAVSLWILVVVTVLFIAQGFFVYFAPANPHRQALRASYVMSGMMFVFLVFVLIHLIPDVSSFGVWCVRISVLCLVLVALTSAEYNWRLVSFLAASGALIVVIAGIAALRYPFLVYGYITAPAAFTSVLMFTYMLFVVPIGLLITVPPLVWFYSMYARALPES